MSGPNALYLLVYCSIEGEFVPLEGDEVTYNLVKIPPKMEKEQAVHVKIEKLKPGETHYRWDSSPVTPPQ